MKTASTEKHRLTLDLDRDLFALLARRAVEHKLASADDPSSMAEICREALVFYLTASTGQIKRWRRQAEEEGGE